MLMCSSSPTCDGESPGWSSLIYGWVRRQDQPDVVAARGRKSFIVPKLCVMVQTLAFWEDAFQKINPWIQAPKHCLLHTCDLWAERHSKTSRKNGSKVTYLNWERWQCFSHVNETCFTCLLESTLSKVWMIDILAAEQKKHKTRSSMLRL